MTFHMHRIGRYYAVHLSNGNRYVCPSLSWAQHIASTLLAAGWTRA